MKRYIYVLFALAFFCSCTPAVKKAKATSLDSVYNAGIIKTDSITHTFYIKSDGTADLKIDTVITSCDCVGVTWEKDDIKPGDKGYIKVTFLPNKAAKGNGVKYLLVKTNSTDKLNTYAIKYKL